MAHDAPRAALDINVHPLVVLSIADHITRDIVQTKKGRVIGVLFGTQSGRQVDIFETTELSFSDPGDGDIKLDLRSFETDYKLFCEAYPMYELLGWYSQGNSPFPNDKAIHETIKGYNDRPLYMMLDNEVDDNARELPIKMFEEQVSVGDDGKVSFDFGQTPYEIRADESERITVVHCARGVGEDEGSSVRSHYSTLSKAVRTLNQRVQVIHQYLQDYEENKVPMDHGILRNIKGLTGLLPTMDSPEFSEDFLNEYNDALLLTYLSSVTKGCNVVNDIVEKFNLTFSRSGSGRMGGIGSGMDSGRMHGGMGGGGGIGGLMSMMGVNSII